MSLEICKPRIHSERVFPEPAGPTIRIELFRGRPKTSVCESDKLVIHSSYVRLCATDALPIALRSISSASVSAFSDWEVCILLVFSLSIAILRSVGQLAGTCLPKSISDPEDASTSKRTPLTELFKSATHLLVELPFGSAKNASKFL